MRMCRLKCQRIGNGQRWKIYAQRLDPDPHLEEVIILMKAYLSLGLKMFIIMDFVMMI